MTLFTLAAEAVAIATARAVLLARALPVAGQTPAPSWADMPPCLYKTRLHPQHRRAPGQMAWAARFFKTRSLAAEEIHKGRVSINGSTAKAAREVRVGDTIALRQGNMPKTVVVRGISGTRGPAAVAQLLYDETEESQQQRLQLTGAAPPGPRTGRRHQPTTPRPPHQTPTPRFGHGPQQRQSGERWSAHWQE